MEKIVAVYQIVNVITNERYIGLSVDVNKRWRQHKAPSSWKNHPNILLYKAMQEYGLDKFRFQILVPVMQEYLKKVEQEFIDMLKPEYNNNNAKGFNVKRREEYYKEYYKANKARVSNRQATMKYLNQLCYYNGETLKLYKLAYRFSKVGIKAPYKEAVKYII